MINIVMEFWNVLAEMAPYLLFGFFVAGTLSVFISPKTIENHFGGKGILPIIKAALFGIPLPLCSCGVIPVAASLGKHGASRSAVVTFLLATPQTGVDSILVTFSLLGPVLAVLRPIGALMSSVLGGILVMIFDSKKPLKNHVTPKCEASCCSETNKHGKLYNLFHYGFITLAGDLSKSLFAGLFIAAMISVFVPPTFFSSFLKPGWMSMLTMMILGIPVYVCATASVPIAVALIAKGISPGAALVFLMTGPATNAATFTTVWSVIGKRATLLYLITIAGSALGLGLLVDWLFSIEGFSISSEMVPMLPSWLKNTCAIALICVLSRSMLKKCFKKTDHHAHPVKK